MDQDEDWNEEKSEAQRQLIQQLYAESEALHEFRQLVKMSNEACERLLVIEVQVRTFMYAPDAWNPEAWVPESPYDMPSFEESLRRTALHCAAVLVQACVQSADISVPERIKEFADEVKIGLCMRAEAAERLWEYLVSRAWWEEYMFFLSKDFGARSYLQAEAGEHIEHGFGIAYALRTQLQEENAWLLPEPER